MSKNKIIRPLVLFGIGGLLYVLVEIIWRGHSHVSMLFAGGFCFVIIGCLNEWFSWELGFVWQSLIGAVVITTIEFIFGLVVNVWLGLNVWDYSSQPFNILGQVCLSFSATWIVISAVVIVMDDYLRYLFFNEEKPHYTVF